MAFLGPRQYQAQMAMMMDPYGMMTPRERHHSKKHKEPTRSLWLLSRRAGKGETEEKEGAGDARIDAPRTCCYIYIGLKAKHDPLLEDKHQGFQGST